MRCLRLKYIPFLPTRVFSFFPPSFRNFFNTRKGRVALCLNRRSGDGARRFAVSIVLRRVPLFNAMRRRSPFSTKIGGNRCLRRYPTGPQGFHCGRKISQFRPIRRTHRFALFTARFSTSHLRMPSISTRPVLFHRTCGFLTLVLWGLFFYACSWVDCCYRG